MSHWLFFWLFFKASLLSSGGMGNLPSLHADLIARHAATERQFGEALTLGNVAPGPNGLWVVSLGYLAGGPWVALLAALAILLPPLLILAVERLYRRVQDHPAVEGFVRGLGLAVVGVFLVALAGIFAGAGVSARGLVLLVAAALLASSRRVPVVGIVGAAALVGVAWH